MYTAGKRHRKLSNRKHNKKHLTRKTTNKSKSLLINPIEKFQKNIKPLKSLNKTIRKNLDDVQKSLKPKEISEIPGSLTDNLLKKDRDFLKSPKELIPQSQIMGGSNILTYEQNNYQNDPQYSMVDTRHIYNEQQNQTIQGGRKTMKRGKCSKCGKKCGNKCNKKSW